MPDPAAFDGLTDEERHRAKHRLGPAPGEGGHSSPGNSSPRSATRPGQTPAPAPDGDPKRAPTTGNPSTKDPAGESSTARPGTTSGRVTRRRRE